MPQIILLPTNGGNVNTLSKIKGLCLSESVWGVARHMHMRIITPIMKEEGKLMSRIGLI